MFQFFVKSLSLCWITGDHTIHPLIEGLLHATGFESTPFQNSASKAAESQVHTKTYLIL